MNLFEMNVANDCKFGFYVTLDSCSNGKYAMVVGIDGVEEGKMIEGTSPYFTRKYPEGHPKAGKTWKRFMYLEATWYDKRVYKTD